MEDVSMEARHGGTSEFNIRCSVPQTLKRKMFLICKCTVTIATTVESLFVVLNWVFMPRIVVSAIHENNKNIVRPGKQRVG